MKFLTIRQPYASLIAVGVKTIETRPFSTKYRGPLAIHAGKVRPKQPGDLEGLAETWMRPDGLWLAYWDGSESQSTPCPLGAVVAVCDLTDVVPIVGGDEVVMKLGPSSTPRCVVSPVCYPVRYTGEWPTAPGRAPTSVGIDDQIPFGDFTPGRYAWLLDNIRPVDPVPMKGAQGLRDLPAEIEAECKERQQ